MKRHCIVLLSVIIVLSSLITGCSNNTSDASGINAESDSYSKESVDSTQSQNKNTDSSVTVPESSDTENSMPTVYFTSDISPEGLMAVYEALGWEPTGNVAVKLSTGEPPASNYLRPELI